MDWLPMGGRLPESRDGSELATLSGEKIGHLVGKVALVTGAAVGLGNAFARTLAAEVELGPRKPPHQAITG